MQAVQRGRGSKEFYLLFFVICLLSIGVIMGFISVSIYAQTKRIMQSGVEIMGTALKTETRVRQYTRGSKGTVLCTICANLKYKNMLK
jgi:uncharacterized protein (UPF0333 family)